MNDIEYCIERVDSGNRGHAAAVDRMVAGPIDHMQGLGIPPVKLLSVGHNYRLLTVDTWTDGVCKSQTVGYIRFRTKPSSRSEVLIEEFEIFREYRAKGHGRKFAKAMLEYKQYFDDRRPALVQPIGIDGSEAFWIRAFDMDHFTTDIEHCCKIDDFDFTGDRHAILDIMCQERRYGPRMWGFMHDLLDAILGSNEKENIFFRVNPDAEFFDHMASICDEIKKSRSWNRIFRNKVL